MERGWTPAKGTQTPGKGGSHLADDRLPPEYELCPEVFPEEEGEGAELELVEEEEDGLDEDFPEEDEEGDEDEPPLPPDAAAAEPFRVEADNPSSVF